MFNLNLQNLGKTIYQADEVRFKINTLIHVAEKCIIKCETPEDLQKAEASFQYFNNLLNEINSSITWVDEENISKDLTDWFFAALNQDMYGGFLDNKVEKICDFEVGEWLYNIFPEDMEKALEAFINYTDSIIRMKYNVMLLRLEIADSDDRMNYQSKVKEYDADRRRFHNAAIEKMNMLNNICKQHDYDLFFPYEISHETRGKIATAIFVFLKQWHDYH